METRLILENLLCVPDRNKRTLERNVKSSSGKTLFGMWSGRLVIFFFFFFFFFFLGGGEGERDTEREKRKEDKDEPRLHSIVIPLVNIS